MNFPLAFLPFLHIDWQIKNSLTPYAFPFAGIGAVMVGRILHLWSPNGFFLVALFSSFDETNVCSLFNGVVVLVNFFSSDSNLLLIYLVPIIDDVQ